MNRDVHLHGIVLTGRIESNLKAVVLWVNYSPSIARKATKIKLKAVNDMGKCSHYPINDRI